MQKYIIHGGKPLRGEVTVSGAKNSTVALIPAAIMADSPTVLEGVPDISDVHALIDILEDFGVACSFKNNTLTIDPTDMRNLPMHEGKIQSLRASYYFMGALLGKYGEGIVGLPGGCSIGPRPIDLHIKGFEALGATVQDTSEGISLTTPNGLHGAEIYMDLVSVGATINVMLAAVCSEGETIIDNAAREPEIIDAATLLNKMGADIHGVGTSTIRINGVKQLHGVTHQIIPDRIEAGTYLTAAAAIGDGVTINNVIPEHIDGLLAKMGEMGVEMDVYPDKIDVHPRTKALKNVNIKTMPYPGFATDLQQPLTPLLLISEGRAVIRDTVYPKRIGHVDELRKMNGNIATDNDAIEIEGPATLHGARVSASDLRAGAALVVAGLIADGETIIDEVSHILRGYDDIQGKFQQLGADIQLVDD